jgi:hypothetical protein
MNILRIKIIQICSFLLIVFPAKILLPNGLVLLLNFLDLISEIFESDDFYFDIYYVTLIIALLSIFCILIKKRLLNLIGILFQCLYLVYAYKTADINNVLYLFTISLYSLISLTVIFRLFSKEINENNK